MKEAQTLARHAKPQMTLGVYGRTREERLHQVVEQVAMVLHDETQRVSSVHRANLAEHVRSGSPIQMFTAHHVRMGLRHAILPLTARRGRFPFRPKTGSRPRPRSKPTCAPCSMTWQSSVNASKRLRHGSSRTPPRRSGRPRRTRRIRRRASLRPEPRPAKRVGNLAILGIGRSLLPPTGTRADTRTMCMWPYGVYGDARPITRIKSLNCLPSRWT